MRPSLFSFLLQTLRFMVSSRDRIVCANKRPPTVSENAHLGGGGAAQITGANWSVGYCATRWVPRDPRGGAGVQPVDAAAGNG